MKAAIARTLLNGCALAGSDFAGIVAGFMAWKTFAPSANQILVQLPAAVIFTTVFFYAWTVVLRMMFGSRLLLYKKADRAWCYVAALALFPLGFVSIHFMYSGYLTDFSNVVAGWLFQLPVNAFVLAFIRGRS